ncbi:hypothetical protein acsn021_29650 [Anaerocolumna cellulosilytica]|uniref:Uncharacterized protein n=1 Tax=Anaerocolumna cellulosilytica TaxID=433286 RepID=A0A6S6R035_9FIRM|nr:hypothetical protein [Anaerocolumna cellulosilytica]MBB5197183.1 hypothetical protein [Anaerocolumna cellulosilytica]BCJ95396.1 hypothetical protein acsn021_29650 [Anaerocolumna cellulosilytica]
MKWNKNVIVFFTLLIISSWFIVFHFIEGANLRKQYTSIGVRFTSGGMTAQSITNALEREKSTGSSVNTELTAWKSVKETIIKNKYLNRSKTVTALLVKGDMSDVASMGLISGSFVYPGDSRGCLIDIETAYALFGTKSVVQNTVSFNNKEYYIRGVVKMPIPVIMLQQDLSTEEYSCLELKYEDMENSIDKTKIFLSKYGFEKNYVIIDGYFYGRLIYTIAALPVWIFYLLISWWLLKQVIAEKPRVKKTIFFVYLIITLLLLFSGAGLLYQLTGNPFYFSERYIPTKWSDFEFWKTKWMEFRGELLQIRYVIPNHKDVLLYDTFIKYVQIPVKIIMLYLLLIYSGIRIKEKIT